MPQERLTEEYVRKIARLSRLAIGDDEVRRYQEQLSAVLEYVERLRGLDLAGVEPLTNVANTTNRLDEDVAGATLDVGAMKRLAPETYDRFIRVPKVLDESGSS